MKIYRVRERAQYSDKHRPCLPKIRLKLNKNVQNHVINHLSTLLKRNMVFKTMSNLIRFQQYQKSYSQQETLILFRGGPEIFPKYLDIHI